MYRNPKVRELFEEFGYDDIRPTGADASNQNGPVERAHCTVANAIRAMLIGANLGVQFWPYAFLHVLRIQNALPGAGQTESPIFQSTGKKENFKNLDQARLRKKQCKESTISIVSLPTYFLVHRMNEVVGMNDT